MNTHSIERGTHPPTFLVLFEPLTELPLRTAYWTWTGLNFVALAAALVMLLGRRSLLPLGTTLVVAALALLYPPVFLHFCFGQSNILSRLMLARCTAFSAPA